mmetsp:Transcript_90336/g.255422  ORF Transcript_90336/g.255422 Transcript_90336/m.255422 type:complete len:100 (+) Transcript_90336:715-1014(+)
MDWSHDVARDTSLAMLVFSVVVVPPHVSLPVADVKANDFVCVALTFTAGPPAETDVDVSAVNVCENEDEEHFVRSTALDCADCCVSFSELEVPAAVLYP